MTCVGSFAMSARGLLSGRCDVGGTQCENHFLPLSQTGYLQSKNEWPRMVTIGRIVLPIMVIIGRIATNGYYRRNSYSCRNRNDYNFPLEQNVIVLWDCEGTDCCL